MAETLITEQTSIHQSKRREKIDTTIYQKDDSEKQRIKNLKKEYKKSLKCQK